MILSRSGCADRSGAVNRRAMPARRDASRRPGQRDWWDPASALDSGSIKRSGFRRVGGRGDTQLMATRTLTDLEMRILAFEAKWEGRSGAKGAAARAEFGWSHAAYEQKLQRLLEEPAALIADPMLVKRAIELRRRRADQRASRTFSRAS